ncbi:thiamine-phosphate kinase [Pseudomonadota bacterium]
MPTQKPGSEFDIIARHFKPLANGHAGALGLNDDAAVLDVPDGQQLVVTTDALVEGVHFLSSLSPQDIAHKVVGVNLSDLAAMGATPHAVFLAAQFPATVTEDWIASFAHGLGEALTESGAALLGGDTVSTPGPMAFTLTAHGFASKSQVLTRAGAQVGDRVFVSGTIGDGALGLLVLTGKLDGDDFLGCRYARPEPRWRLGQLLGQSGLVSACADVSDGLVADAGHIAEASQCDVELDATLVPLSAAARRQLKAHPDLLGTVLTGGDDYELVFTADAHHAVAIQDIADQAGVTVTAIGEVVEGTGRVRVQGPGGQVMDLGAGGYRHL